MKTHSLNNHAFFAAPLLFAVTLAAHAAPQTMPVAANRMPQTAAQTNAVISPPATDIRDIRGPKPITSPWLMPLVALTVLSAAGGAYAAWAWNRRRFREASKRPLDVALERLERARLLMVPPRGREFSIEVSSAVRDYIESRFDLRAAHLTTDEFLHQLLEPADSLLAAHRSLLDNFLQTCDLAKFGGWNLAAADMETMLHGARQFIVESADDAVPPRAPAAADVLVDQTPTSNPRETYVSLPST